MTRFAPLVLFALLAGCAARPTVVPPAQERFDNSARSSFVALGTVAAVADALVAGLAEQECLEVQRGLDAAGVVAISLRDSCPGRTNRGLVRLIDGGDGTVRGTTEAVYSGASTPRSLAVLPTGALFRQDVPVFTLAVPEAGRAPCQTVESWRARLDEPPAGVTPRDTTVQADEVSPVLVGGMEGFQRSVQYPDLSRRAGIEGRTLVRFVVDPTGAVSCAELLVSISPELDAESLRAVRAAQFSPGMQDGRPVPVRMTLPIWFQIN